MVEFFRRRASVGFKENSLEVNTHLMAFLRGICLFMKLFSDTTISYEVVRGNSDFTEYCRGKEEREVLTRGDICYFLDPVLVWLLCKQQYLTFS